MIRCMKAARPPFCNEACRISGVLGHTFGVKKSETGGFVISSKYACNSAFAVLHVKYVYDCEKPPFANEYMMCGRVKASARKMASGAVLCSSLMHHSQNGSAFVCGLSTRKT